mmetsp:Transcript_1375/g.2426  ORF Transcript_1375/g.2426 Transcript_1375/m.2426 type:complete len:213 (-) Transcript_1375:378-1016(-)
MRGHAIVAELDRLSHFGVRGGLPEGGKGGIVAQILLEVEPLVTIGVERVHLLDVLPPLLRVNQEPLSDLLSPGLRLRLLLGPTDPASLSPHRLVHVRHLLVHKVLILVQVLEGVAVVAEHPPSFGFLERGFRSALEREGGDPLLVVDPLLLPDLLHPVPGPLLQLLDGLVRVHEGGLQVLELGREVVLQYLLHARVVARLPAPLRAGLLPKG